MRRHPIDSDVGSHEGSPVMEEQNFGTVLRQARERQEVTLGELARATKVSRAQLELIEAGRLDGLPPEVFVRGFIRSYARFLGVSDARALGLFDHAVEARRKVEEAKYQVPSRPAADSVASEDDALHPRRGIGLAVFVIIVLVIATITWSLFLRQPPQSGESLSFDAPASSEPARTKASPARPGRSVRPAGRLAG